MLSRPSKKNYWTTILAIICAGALRLSLVLSQYQKVIANRVEVSTPLNSWRRVTEALYLFSRNVDPYEGDMLRETPLAMSSYKVLSRFLQDKIYFIFILVDVATGVLLWAAAKKYALDFYEVEKETIKECIPTSKETREDYVADPKEKLVKPLELSGAPLYVLLVFLFNPFSVLSCVGYATTVFHNFFLALTLLSMLYEIPLISGASLAVCASLSLYPATLLIPVSLYLIKVSKSYTKAAINAVAFVICAIGFFLCCSKNLTDFRYLYNVYGCLLTVQDHQPNIGIFWYLFTMLPASLRSLYLWCFQINATVLYPFPLSFLLRKQPFFCTFAVLQIISIFKSYPSVGDVGFTFSLLPCFAHLFPYCTLSFWAFGWLLGIVSYTPHIWHLWIYNRTTNANFYFAASFIFAASHIMLLADLLYAYKKREFFMKHGLDKTKERICFSY